MKPYPLTGEKESHSLLTHLNNLVPSDNDREARMSLKGAKEWVRPRFLAPSENRSSTLPSSGR